MKKGIIIGLFLGVLITGLIFIFLNKKEVVSVKKEIVNEESVVTKVVEESTPSVVTIRTEQDVGTGFIISSDGLIVTNKHVVADVTVSYKVVIGKDEVVEVKNIYRDPLNDLAIIKIEKTNLNMVNLGDSDKLKVGQSVIAIGTALGEFRSTVTTGVISGLGRGITAGAVGETEKLDNVIQTDAAINPGNSGGPLFNSSGEVIGVNVAVSQSGQNIGFALPINLIKESIAYFRKTGEFERPYLGVGYKMIKDSGAWVQSVSENSPAFKAGIEKGDIITEVDSEKLIDSDSGDLVKVINTKKIGDVIEVKIWREKIEKTIKVTLEKKIN
ncbi:MAG: trypsin-like peptidase domain-containing protein [Candidatus Shapirobacteria bacterium]|nr:trypsin-like peptidase domain-containing protein [Candidatus Shapirobacteria bacterium]MDD4410338.1 trypsin-like peptidase domain-containing protein [Candidatus Shapirobacteria bacterium]